MVELIPSHKLKQTKCMWALHFILFLLYYPYFSIICCIFWICGCSRTKISTKIILAQEYNKGGCVLALGLNFLFTVLDRMTNIFFLWPWQRKKRELWFLKQMVSHPEWVQGSTVNYKPCILMDLHDSLITEGLWFRLQVIRIKIMYAIMWLFKSLIIIIMALFYLNLNVHFSEIWLSSLSLGFKPGFHLHSITIDF